MDLSFNHDQSEQLTDRDNSINRDASGNGGSSRDSLDDSVLTHEASAAGANEVQVVSGRRVDLRSITSYKDLENSKTNTSGNGVGLVAAPRSRVHSMEAARPASEMIDPMGNPSNDGKSSAAHSSTSRSGGTNSNISRSVSPSVSNTSRSDSTTDGSYDASYSSANESQQQNQGLNVQDSAIRHQASNSSLAGSARSAGKPARRLSLSKAANRSRTSLINLGARMGGPRNGSKVDLEGGSSVGISSDDVRQREQDGARSITPTKERIQNGRTTPTQSSVRGAPGRVSSSAGTGSGNKSLDGTTVAQLYAVFGLPKDPSVWTLAEEDCVAGVHHIEGAVGRFWRPEVLGCSICPSPAEVLGKEEGNSDGRPESTNGKNKKPSSVKSGTAGSGAAGKWEGRGSDGKKPSNPKFIEMADGRGGVEKAETARVLSKALKVRFFSCRVRYSLLENRGSRSDSQTFSPTALLHS